MKVTDTRSRTAKGRGHKLTLQADTPADREALKLLAYIVNLNNQPIAKLIDGLGRALANEKPESATPSG